MSLCWLLLSAAASDGEITRFPLPEQQTDGCLRPYCFVEEEEEDNLFAKKAGCQKGLQPVNAGYHINANCNS